MGKIALFLCFAFSSLTAAQVERIEFDGHQYLVFECKAVLHDPDCTACNFNPHIDDWEIIWYDKFK